MLRVFGIWALFAFPIIFVTVWLLNAVRPSMAVVYIATFGAMVVSLLILAALDSRHRDRTDSSRQS